MVAAPAALTDGGASGIIRPVNIRRDLREVSALLRLSFGGAMQADSRAALDTAVAGQDDMWFGLFSLSRSRVVPGFVWEEEGRIVGNVSLLPSSVSGRYLVANVAVHPAHRRRGIARRLMLTTLREIMDHHGQVVMLQVEHDNWPAIYLYERLGFTTLGKMTTWYVNYAQFRQLSDAGSGRSPDQVGQYCLRPLRGSEWRQAFELDRRSVQPDLTWPVPQSYQAYKQGFWAWLRNFMNGRQLETWVVADEQVDKKQEKLLGLAQITSEWGRAHRLRLRVHPAGQGQWERPLLAKLLRRLRYLANRNVRIEHPAGDETTNQLLMEANFTAQRTLAVMRLDL